MFNLREAMQAGQDEIQRIEERIAVRKSARQTKEAQPRKNIAHEDRPKAQQQHAKRRPFTMESKKNPKHPFTALIDKFQAERNLSKIEATRLAIDTDPALCRDFAHTIGLTEASRLADDKGGGDLRDHEFNRLIQAKMQKTGCSLSDAMREVVAEHPHVHENYILASQNAATSN